MTRRLMVVGLLTAVFATLTLTACGDDDGSSVDVSLFEWTVEADPATASAGSVTFNASNDGSEAHELVIVKANSASDLPTDDTGKVDEDGLAAGAFIGEIEEFDAGGSESASFDLSAGTYILFCNIVEQESDGSFESHFQEGMVTTFTVTG